MKRTTFFLLLLLVGATCFSLPAQETSDSILQLLDKQTNEVKKVPLFNNLAEHYKRKNMDSSYFFAQQALQLATDYQLINEKARAFVNIGNYHLQKGSYTLAMENYFLGLKLLNESEISSNLGTLYNNLGSTYYRKGDNEHALEYYKKSLAVFEKLNDKLNSAKISLNIGNINLANKNFEIAEFFTLHAIDGYREAGYDMGILSAYVNLNVIYNEWGKLNQALSAIEEIKNIAPKNSEYLQAVIAVNEGYTYFLLKNYSKAELLLSQAAGIAQKLAVLDLLKEASLKLSNLYQITMNYQKAYEYHKLYKQTTDSLNQQTNSEKFAELEMTYKFEKKQKELDLKRQQEALAEQKQRTRLTVTILIVSGLLFTAILIALLINKNRSRLSRLNTQLEEANEEVNAQKERLEQANAELSQQKELLALSHQQITDSINYARRIQVAVFPTTKIFEQHHIESFLLNKPRDVVSGDFYWVDKIDRFLVFAVADCTGHGVPGAFMSMLGISLLNQIANRRSIRHASEALEELRENVIQALNKNEHSESRDGMDMAICVYDTQNKSLEYAGANAPVLFIRDNQVVEPQYVRNPIGTYLKKRNFIDVNIQLQENDTLYLFTDGYKDQLGQNNSTFKAGRLKTLLENIHAKPMNEQKLVLNQTIQNWQGNTKQTDDILVLGLRF